MESMQEGLKYKWALQKATFSRSRFGRQPSQVHHKIDRGFQRFKSPLKIADGAKDFAGYGFVVARLELNTFEIRNSTL